MATADPKLSDDDVRANEMAKNAGDEGVQTSTGSSTQGGLPGMLGFQEAYNIYTPDVVSNKTLSGDKAALAAQIANANNLPTNAVMQQTTVGPAAQATTTNAQSVNAASAPQVSASAMPGDVRSGETTLASQLAAQASGQGPTLSDQQFKTDTDRGLAQSLAMAASARGVNPSQAMRQAADSQANIQGQAAAQQFTNSQQEQMNARAQLAGVLGQTGSQDLSARGQDIGVSSTNAANAQQVNLANAAAGNTTNLANAGAANANSQFNTGATNSNAQLQAQLTQAAKAATFNGQLDMTKFKSELVQQYLQAGVSLDQANYQADIQQRQYAAGLLAQQTAAEHGISSTNAAGQAQMAGAAMQASGAMLAAAMA